MEVKEDKIEKGIGMEKSFSELEGETSSKISDRVRGFEVVTEWKDKEIKLPERGTANSAGYDFFCTSDVRIPSNLFDIVKYYIIHGLKDRDGLKLKPYIVKTGVKAYMGSDEVLFLYNRSSNPKKLGLIFANSVGVIDSDYYNNKDNEGEIMVMFYNIYPFPVTLHKGDKICQGVFQKFLKTDNDSNTNKVRIGGIGSTGK